MLSLDAAIALGGAKQPLNERRPSSASSFCSKTGVDPSADGGGGGGRLCVILAKWGVGVNPHRGVNPREYGIYICIWYRFPLSLSTIWGNDLPFNFMLKFPISTIGIEDIMDIDSNCPYLLFGETTSHLTSKWRGTFQYFPKNSKNVGNRSSIKQAPVGTGMSRARNLRWGMLLHVNAAGIYGGQHKIGVLVHVYHVGIAIYTW